MMWHMCDDVTCVWCCDIVSFELESVTHSCVSPCLCVWVCQLLLLTSLLDRSKCQSLISLGCYLVMAQSFPPDRMRHVMHLGPGTACSTILVILIRIGKVAISRSISGWIFTSWTIFIAWYLAVGILFACMHMTRRQSVCDNTCLAVKTSMARQANAAEGSETKKEDL